MAQSNRILSIPFLVLACAALLLMPACGGGSVSGTGTGAGSSPSPPAGTPLSSLELSPATLTVLRGNSGTSTLTTTVSAGFQNPISLTSSGAPQGTSVSFDRNTIPAPGSGSSTITIAVGSGTATGSYSIVVTGSRGGSQATAQLKLNVIAEVFLHWDRSDSGDIVGYNLARSTTPGQGYTRINSSLITDTSYSDQTVQSGHTYYYVATAVDAAGNESAPSNMATATVE
jgi:hypothetical protein